MLILAIAEDLNKLLENGRMASITSLRKLCGVVVMAVHLPIVLIVTILCAEHSWAYRAGEVIDVVFPIQSCDI